MNCADKLVFGKQFWVCVEKWNVETDLDHINVKYLFCQINPGKYCIYFHKQILHMNDYFFCNFISLKHFLKTTIISILTWLETLLTLIWYNSLMILFDLRKISWSSIFSNQINHVSRIPRKMTIIILYIIFFRKAKNCIILDYVKL